MSRLGRTTLLRRVAVAGSGGGSYTIGAPGGAGGNSYSSATITSGSATNAGAGYVTFTLN
jgi:hypothetical protein